MTAEPAPRASILSTTTADPTPHRPSYNADLGDSGIVRVHCGNLVLMGMTADDAGPNTVSVIVGQQGCACGCRVPGRAFEYAPTPEQARMLAAQLIAAADAVDAHATLQATSLLDRIRNGAPR